MIILIDHVPAVWDRFQLDGVQEGEQSALFALEEGVVDVDIRPMVPNDRVENCACGEAEDGTGDRSG